MVEFPCAGPGLDIFKILSHHVSAVKVACIAQSMPYFVYGHLPPFRFAVHGVFNKKHINPGRELSYGIVFSVIYAYVYICCIGGKNRGICRNSTPCEKAVALDTPSISISAEVGLVVSAILNPVALPHWIKPALQ